MNNEISMYKIFCQQEESLLVDSSQYQTLD